MLITMDFESAYGVHPRTKEKLTLTSMTNEEYIRHPLFKVHCVGIKVGNHPTFYAAGADIKRVFAKIPWDKAAVISHHAHFDMAILSWIYGCRPQFILDTLSMANALYPWASNSLDNLCKRLEVRRKGTELVLTKDKWTLTPELMRTLGGYCTNDVDITREVFDIMVKDFPREELRLIDATVRMFSEPALETDGHILLEEYKREIRGKRQFMQQAGINKGDLMSNAKFAEALEGVGVTPPTKVSPKTGKTGFAFAKSDEEFKQLLDHPNEKVQWLVEARLAVKSTIKETRAKRFWKIGSRGKFPIYLKYYGAHTGRWSGGDKINPQNMTRYDPSDPTSGALRRSLVAPPGMVCVVRDLSQIEARMLAYVAGQEDMLEVFRTGGDPYDHMASRLYGRAVQRKVNPEDKAAGMVGKASVLGCGYSMGWAKFQDSLRVGFLGMPGTMFDETFLEALRIDLAGALATPVHRGRNAPTLEEAAMECRPAYVPVREHLMHCAVTKTIVDRYRGANDKVVDLWGECDQAIINMVRGNPTEVGTLVTMRCVDDSVYLPNGMRVQYHGLSKDKTYITKAHRSNAVQRTKIYGGKMVENLIQALARIVIGEQQLRIAQRYKVVTSTHDEIVIVAPEAEAQEALDFMGEVMCQPPEWAPDLPLDSAGGFAKSYGLCDK